MRRVGRIPPVVLAATCVVCFAAPARADRPARIADWHNAVHALLPAAIIDNTVVQSAAGTEAETTPRNAESEERRRDRFALDFEVADQAAASFSEENPGVFVFGARLTPAGEETLRRLRRLEHEALFADEFEVEPVFEAADELQTLNVAYEAALAAAPGATREVAAAAARRSVTNWELMHALPYRGLVSGDEAAALLAAIAEEAGVSGRAQALKTAGRRLDRLLVRSASRLGWALRFQNPWYRGPRYERSPQVEAEEDQRPPHPVWAGEQTQAFLGRLRDDPDAAAVFLSVEPPFPQYQALRQTLARYLEIEAAGGFPSMEGMRVRKHRDDPRVVAVRERLAIEGLDTVTDSPSVYGESLINAVSEYQRRHQLDVDGDLGPGTLRTLAVPVERRIAEIWLSMHKWRMSRRAAHPNGEFIWSNLPSYTAELWDGGARVHQWKVVVGRRNYAPGDNPNATPEMSAVLEYMVLNPSWYVPDRIWRTTLHDRFQRRPELMREAGYEIVSGSGLDARVRQLPGPRNGLGRVKFMFPNRHAVFMHDTLGQHRFLQPRRAYSHGCLRAENALELATFLYQRDRHVSAEQAETEIQTVVDSEEERRVRLERGIPVHLEYITVSVDDEGKTHFFLDMYLRNERQLRRIERKREALREQ